jgi:hypothetical protein
MNKTDQRVVRYPELIWWSCIVLEMDGVWFKETQVQSMHNAFIKCMSSFHTSVSVYGPPRFYLSTPDRGSDREETTSFYNRLSTRHSIPVRHRQHSHPPEL